MFPVSLRRIMQPQLSSQQSNRHHHASRSFVYKQRYLQHLTILLLTCPAQHIDVLRVEIANVQLAMNQESPMVRGGSEGRYCL